MSMNIALFLDVDWTLTKEYIQQVYARQIGCEDGYLEIERKFQNQQISSAEFGQEIIELFAANGFTEQKAGEYFNKVELQPWTDELLKIDTDIYLVSSGPNYYIERLASSYNIPSDRTCNSVYYFQQTNKLIKGCSAINDLHKAMFVKEHVGRYDLTIGIGDHL